MDTLLAPFPTNDKTTFLNIILEEDVFQLDDVVVVGYGSMKKGEVTSAITSVKKDDFLAGMVKVPNKLLQESSRSSTFKLYW